MSDEVGFENIASSCRHEYAHYEDEMFRDSFDPEVLLRAADEIERLRGQVKAAHKILGSESFGWLVIGSEHEVAHWKALSPHIDEYWDKYGTYFRPKPVA